MGARIGALAGGRERLWRCVLSAKLGTVNGEWEPPGNDKMDARRGAVVGGRKTRGATVLVNHIMHSEI